MTFAVMRWKKTQDGIRKHSWGNLKICELNFEVNDMQYMNEYNVDKYYKKIEMLKHMYENQLNEESGISNSFINFERSARFIYISMKEFENVRWNGSDIPLVEFVDYFPNYSIMNQGQFEYYFYWRAQVLDGNIQNCDLSYFYLFIYEILAGLHAQNKEEGYTLLTSMYRKFREYNKKVDKYLISWIVSYCIINDMYVQKKNELEDYVSKDEKKAYEWKQDWKIVNEDFTDCFEAVMRASAYKLDKKSKFYLENKDARIIKEVFDRAFNAINECMKQHNLILSEFLIGQKGKEIWKPYQATPWEYDLYLFSDSIQYEQSFEFAGEIYEYNFEKKEWCKDAILRRGIISGGQIQPIRYIKMHNGEFIAYLVKVIENICREKVKYNRKLNPQYTKQYGTVRLNVLADSGEIEKVVEEVVDTYIEKEKFAFEEIPVAKPKVNIKKKIIEKNEFEIEMLYGRTDRSKIEEARQVLYNNQEKLVIEDREGELKNIKIENESSDNSDIQIGILKLLIDSSAGFEAAKRFAESKGTNIVLEIEKINEKALDEIGDMLIDTDGVDYYIYDEYKDYIKKL